ncbi:hypothetical protein HHI36_015302 [Cryptolaemus montrouzieri]|uniref:Cytochrome P450 n=1 Tax=Cryptolaemus montrouzieri TaxID=559131 RepID=A0ABD2N557_9CUCU
MLWLILLAVFLVIFYLYTVKLNHYWKDRGVKHEFVIPPFGNNLKPLFKSQPFFEMVEEFYYKFPEERCTGLFQFTTPVLMLKDLELIKELCVKDFEYFLDHSAFLKEDTDPLWSKNLFALTGQKWRDMRATLSPSFTGSKMRQMFMLVQKCSENFVNYFEQNSSDIIEIELKDAFSKYTNDIIATTAFGIQCDSLENPENEFYVRGKQTTDFSGVWKNLKFMLVVMIPWLGKVLDSRMFDKEVSIFFKRIMKETLDYRKKNNIERPDMINLLMHAKKGSLMQDESKKVEERSFAAVEEHLESKHPQEMKAELSLEDITSQALIFFVAGFDTVSTAMCFMAYELALNPDIQQRLIMELDEHRAVNKNLTYEGLAELTYLDMVFSESLRKWPATIATDRQCVKPYTIKSDEQNNKAPTLTPGNLLWIPIWAIHHDPNYWENPDKFDPERFSPENKDKIVPYSYLPFGVGPRNCIGSRFAIMEVKAVFYGLLEKFEIVPTEKTCIPFKPNKRAFTLVSENGFWFGLKKRKSSN